MAFDVPVDEGMLMQCGLSSEFFDHSLHMTPVIHTHTHARTHAHTHTHPFNGPI